MNVPISDQKHWLDLYSTLYYDINNVVGSPRLLLMFDKINPNSYIYISKSHSEEYKLCMYYGSITLMNVRPFYSPSCTQSGCV